jgi:site-specific DNA-methyltransferase (adenine-specific)
MNRALLSSARTEYGTPQPLFDWLDSQFAFNLDAAALPSNAKHPKFFSPADNGLTQSWEGRTAFLNPPYGRGIASWIDKARDEAMHARALVVMLLPARVDANWYRRYVMSCDGEAGRLLRSNYRPDNQVLWLRWSGLITGIHFYEDRVKFDGLDTGAPFPSAIVVHAHPSRRPPAPRLEEGELCLTAGWPR